MTLRNNANTLWFVENDLLPHLSVEWEDEDITGFAVQLHVRRPDGSTFSKVGIIDDYNVGATGSALFHFEWAIGDLIPGENIAEIEATDSAGLNESFPGIHFHVVPEIA